MGIFREEKGERADCQGKEEGDTDRGPGPAVDLEALLGNFKTNSSCKELLLKVTLILPARLLIKSIQLSQTNDRNVLAPTCFPSESNYYRYSPLFCARGKRAMGKGGDSVPLLASSFPTTPPQVPSAPQHRAACLQTQTRTKGANFNISSLCKVN